MIRGFQVRCLMTAEDTFLPFEVIIDKETIVFRIIGSFDFTALEENKITSIKNIATSLDNVINVSGVLERVNNPECVNGKNGTYKSQVVLIKDGENMVIINSTLKIQIMYV